MYEHDPLTERIIGCGIEVHRELGPGLFENTYEEALCLELTTVGISFIRQPGVPVLYKGHLIGEHRPDLVVENRVVVEIKSVEKLIGVHTARSPSNRHPTTSDLTQCLTASVCRDKP